MLRDGASAQYGSDAIAGVINIVLKGADSGGSVSASYGQYTEGDGGKYQVLADAGLKLGGSGKVHLAAQFGHQDQTDRAEAVFSTPADPEVAAFVGVENVLPAHVIAVTPDLTVLSVAGHTI